MGNNQFGHMQVKTSEITHSLLALTYVAFAPFFHVISLWFFLGEIIPSFP